MDWPILTNIIFTFINLIFIGINAYLMHKARTLSYREMLYSKQLEGHTKIFNALTDFYIDASLFFVAKRVKVGEKIESRLYSDASDKYTAFARLHKYWAIFLPKELHSLLAKFIKDFNITLGSTYKNDPLKLIKDAYLEIISETRNSIGTEPLNRETLKLIGKILSDQMKK